MNPSNLDEHLAVFNVHGEVQRRCTPLVSSLTQEIERLRAELMRVRASVIVRDSALAILREDIAALRTVAPGLPKHVEMKRQPALQKSRVEQLQREYAGLPSESVHSTTAELPLDRACSERRRET